MWWGGVDGVGGKVVERRRTLDGGASAAAQSHAPALRSPTRQLRHPQPFRAGPAPSGGAAAQPQGRQPPSSAPPSPPSLLLFAGSSSRLLPPTSSIKSAPRGRSLVPAIAAGSCPAERGRTLGQVALSAPPGGPIFGRAGPGRFGRASRLCSLSGFGRHSTAARPLRKGPVAGPFLRASPNANMSARSSRPTRPRRSRG